MHQCHPQLFPKLQTQIIEGCARLGRSNEWYSLITYIQTNIQPPNQPHAKNRFFDTSFTYRTHSAEFLIHWRLGRTQEGVLQNISSGSDDDAFCRVSQQIAMIHKFLFCFRCFCEFLLAACVYRKQLTILQDYLNSPIVSMCKCAALSPVGIWSFYGGTILGGSGREHELRRHRNDANKKETA